MSDCTCGTGEGCILHNHTAARIFGSQRNLKRTPLKRKPRKKQPGDDPAYLRFIRSQSCELWPNLGRSCEGPIEAHHAGDHGYAQKAPDRTAIPLCAKHHRYGKDSAHVLGKNFWPYHGLKRDRVISELNERYDQHA